MMTRQAWKAYLALALPVSVAYMSAPAETAKLYFWPIIGWSSVIAILVGVAINRPEPARAWYLLAGGVATFMVGDNLYTFRSLVQHSETLFPSYVDVIYLAMYPLLIAGLALLAHRRTAGRDRAGVIDAAIITGALALVSWSLLIAPYVRLADLGVLERIASIAYPVGDVGLVAIAVKLAVGGGRRPPAFWLLAGSLLPLLAADSLYGYANLAGTWYEHNPVDIGWIVFYVGWGTAALHPSMPQLSDATVGTRRITLARLVIIGSAVLVPPVMLFVEDRRGNLEDATAIAAAGALLFGLVLVRIAGLVRGAAEERSEAKFRVLVNHTSDAVLVLDAEGRIRFQTPSAERVLGRSRDELDGELLGAFLADADRERLVVMLTNPSATATFEWRFAGEDGAWRDLEVVASDLRGDRDVDGLVLTMRDVTERKQLDNELRRQALHDALTGLPNRTLFLDRVEHAMERAQRRGGSIAILLLGVDDFKDINDSIGHAGGDRLLASIGARLVSAMPPDSTVARLGGDEFAVLLENSDDDSALELAALSVQATFHQPFLVGADELRMSVSIGMALGSPDLLSPDVLLRDADLAMYVAKRSGKDKYEQYLPAMSEEASRRLELGAELRQAIERNELVAFYQPIVEVATGRPVGVEALVRWQHAERGLLPPSQFVPIAESSGLVIPLGRWMLGEACRQAAQWRELGLVDGDFYVSVNLSARHVQDDELLHDVTDALESSGLAPGALMIEVTETTLIEDLSPAGTTLATLKRLGLRLAVDDFGTGYSSLAYLSNFPLDALKIDKSFIDRVATSVEGETMVRAVVDLAHTLGLTSIAEGVEQPEQADALVRLGCGLAQGFLFARPVPGLQMSTYLARHALPLLDPAGRPRSHLV
jgi:diguanylate cyclase (GGDEF)-like protein/PAS domain S-box-containing protein